MTAQQSARTIMPTQLVWFVTGCSTGFGVEFTKAVLARGDKAIATARNISTLKPLADLGAATWQLDVTAAMSELHEKVKEAVQVYGRVDVMIANAGYAQFGVSKSKGMSPL